MIHPVQILVFLSWGLLVCAQQLPPWELGTFSFGWGNGVYNDTFTRCGTIDLWWNITSTIDYTPTGPYSAILYRAGQMPYRVNAGSGLSYRWLVDLRTGGPYILGMEDGRGATGGLVFLINVVAGSSSCPNSAETSQTLSLRLPSSTVASCDTISFEASEGTPPYTLTVLPAKRRPKTIVFATGKFDYVLDVAAGEDVGFAVEDSTGRSAISQFFRIAQGSSASCLTAASTIRPDAPTVTYPGIVPSSSTSALSPTTTTTRGGPNGQVDSNQGGPSMSSKPSIPAIVGGVIGGLLLIAVGCLLVLFLRRRKKKQSQQAHVASVDKPDGPVQDLQPQYAIVNTPFPTSTPNSNPSYLHPFSTPSPEHSRPLSFAPSAYNSPPNHHLSTYSDQPSSQYTEHDIQAIASRVADMVASRIQDQSSGRGAAGQTHEPVAISPIARDALSPPPSYDPYSTFNPYAGFETGSSNADTSNGSQSNLDKSRTKSSRS